MIQNPIITGFAPDPSICRVGDDYYVAVSSFEWFPGVPIFHSKDLQNWELLDYCLKTNESIDMTGEKPSAGVWAPCLSYSREDGLFYLVYSNVHSKNTWYFDVDNFVITAKSIHGPWSEPVYLCSCGFDYSMFHDTDGRKYIVGKDRDFRTENIDKRAIILQEYDPRAKKLMGKPINISSGGTQRRFVEAPHLYKRNGWYYLMVAEGATGYGHAVVVLRSRNIEGPYECYEGNPIITSHPEEFNASEKDNIFMYDKYNPQTTIQKAGHGSLVETTTGEWYVAHLCGRPLLPELRCILGRETSLQKVMWTDDDRLVMADGSNLAKDQVEGPNVPLYEYPKKPAREDFNSSEMPLEFQSPRTPMEEKWVSLTKMPGFLSLCGRESLTSNYYPSIVARRLDAFHARVEVKLIYAPDDYHYRAGLTFYYDLADYYAVFKTYDERIGKAVLTVEGAIGTKIIDGTEQIEVEMDAPVYLRGIIDHQDLQFYYSTDGENYLPIGQKFNTTNMSDEGGSYAKFTGTYVGMFAQDCLYKNKWAQFDWFDYEDMD